MCVTSCMCLLLGVSVNRRWYWTCPLWPMNLSPPFTVILYCPLGAFSLVRSLRSYSNRITLFTYCCGRVVYWWRLVISV